MAAGLTRGSGPSTGMASDGWIRARAMGLLYLAGATIGAVSLVLPHSARADDGALWSNVGLAYIGAFVILALGARIPSWGFEVGLGVGSLLITRAVLASHDPVSFYTVWYIWIALYAFYFFSRASAAAHVGFAMALYGATLIDRTAPSGFARWLTTVTTVIVAGIFIDTLVRRARRQAEVAEVSASNLATVAEVAHDLARISDSSHARTAVCMAAARLTAAETVAIWEPSGSGSTLELSGFYGPRPPQTSLPFVAAPAGAVRAFANGDVVAGSLDEGVPEFAGDARPPRGCLWQPVLRDSVPIAVLALYWHNARALDDRSLLTTADLLAAEVAATLERAELMVRLESMARTDDLTGLPNRRAWDEELPREVLRSRRETLPLCVAMIDLDHFKEYNDEHGHQAGDRLLKQAAAAWGVELRGTDFLARYGGEEFALALPACPPDEAIAVVERLRAATPQGETASAGIACWNGAESAAALVGRADAALYEAKRQGRNLSLLASTL
jgi:diguanylate cyclase (GGDEF)-like protein